MYFSSTRRLLSALLVLILFGTIFTGCSPKETSVTTPSSAESQKADQSESKSPQTSAGDISESTSEKADESLEPITFDIFLNGATNDWNGWGTDPVTQRFTELTGVSLNVMTATTTDNSQLNGMIASGDLPDFVMYETGSPIRSTLWKQDYLYPLNELMDEYAPDFWDILPKDMDKIYQESDGNFYMFVRYYSDVDRIAKLPGTLNTNSGFTMNVDVYEEMGSPEIKTLEQYHEYLMQVKTTHPEFTYLAYDHFHESPGDNVNMAQLINRAFGGTHAKSIASDDTVHLNFRDESYQKAVVYISSLYRDGLFNPENFTITSDETYESIVRNGQMFSSWGNPFKAYQFNERVDGPQLPFSPPTDDGITMTLNSVITSIGGLGVSITRNCKDPERAIQFFEFYMSDEGQMLMYHGIEGKDYTMVDGMPKNTEEKSKIWTDDFTAMQRDWGIINYNLCFAVTNWTDMLYYYHMNEDKPTYRLDSEINNPLAVNERINGLIQVESDSDFKVLETKIYELWKTSLPKMYLAESEEQCIAAYNELISQAEAMGLADLEAEYTRIYLEWKDKM